MVPVTQNELILRHLKRRGTINQREALLDYNIARLASRIDELRKAGWNIETEMRTHKLTKKRYATYILRKN